MTCRSAQRQFITSVHKNYKAAIFNEGRDFIARIGQLPIALFHRRYAGDDCLVQIICLCADNHMDIDASSDRIDASHIDGIWGTALAYRPIHHSYAQRRL